MNDKTLTVTVVGRRCVYIIAKPDPLVEALNALPNVCCEDEFDADDAAKLREALAKRGFKIVETER